MKNLFIESTQASDEGFCGYTIRQYIYESGFVVSSSFKAKKVSVLLDKFRTLKSFQSLDQTSSNIWPVVFWNEDYYLVIDKHVCLASAKNLESLKKFLELLKDYIRGSYDASDIDVTYYSNSKRGLESGNVNIKAGDFSTVYPELYPNIDIDKLSEAYISSKDSLLMMYGPPGVGKTTFIKCLLLSGRFNNVAYCKDRECLREGELWASLHRIQHDLIIFDDLDHKLARKDDPDGFVSNLLSFTDGIFGTNSKVVITTNEKIENVDAALIRPGRCFDFLFLDFLSLAYARNFWITTLNMKAQIFDDLFGKQKTISQAALMNAHAMVNRSAYVRDYVKEGPKIYSLENKLQEVGIIVPNSTEKRLGFKS